MMKFYRKHIQEPAYVYMVGG